MYNLLERIVENYDIDHINHKTNIEILGDPNIIKNCIIDENKYAIVKHTEIRYGLECTGILLTDYNIEVQLVNIEKMLNTFKVIIAWEEPAIYFRDVFTLTVKDEKDKEESDK